MNLKLKKKPARAVRKDVSPFTQEQYAFGAKPASKIVRAIPMKRLKDGPGHERLLPRRRLVAY